MNRCVCLLAAVAFLVAACGAHAACNVSTTGVNFGPYDIFSLVPQDITGTVVVSCDEVPPQNVTVAIGTSANSGVLVPRRMKHATQASTLDYNLYTNAGRSAVWGDGTGGTSTVLASKVKRNQPPRVVTIYGRIPPSQGVPAGAYADSVTVTITW